MLVPNHPYLRKKRISMLGCDGLRIDADGNLLIPMYRDGKLVSIQRISETGEKKFAFGAPSRNAVFWITRPTACVTIICEGMATGVTLFESLNTAKVCVCFSAGNMVAVAEREEWSGLVAVAGDFDDTICQRHLKEGEHYLSDPELPRPEWCRCNPGATAAMKAAKIIGCGYAIAPSSGGSDWNDAFVKALEAAEEKQEFQPRKISPHKLRASALAPISAALMRAAKMVRVPTSEPHLK